MHTETFCGIYIGHFKLIPGGLYIKYMVITTKNRVYNREHIKDNTDERDVRWLSLMARFMGPTWGPSGADRTQVGPILAP